jgi:hypothetical protein
LKHARTVIIQAGGRPGAAAVRYRTAGWAVARINKEPVVSVSQ